MNFTKNSSEPENADLHDEIAALDADLREEFEPQLSLSPFLSQKIVV